VNPSVPRLEGHVARRVLVNCRTRPGNLAHLLPTPLRLQIVEGQAIFGLCWIRLESVRLAGWPRWTGLSMDNLAHRIAVEWTEAGQVRTGVHIFRRETSLGLAAWTSGRVVPGPMNLGHFDARETGEAWNLDLRTPDSEADVDLATRTADRVPTDSVFHSMEGLRSFLEAGAVGWSANRTGDCIEAMHMAVERFQVQPLEVRHLRCRWFERQLGDAEWCVDSAVRMEPTGVRWMHAGAFATAGRDRANVTIQ